MLSEISFEFFPPKTQAGQTKLQATCKTLNKSNPAYFSVTFGAAGSTQHHTLETVAALRQLSVDVAPHISCINTHKHDIDNMLKQYQSIGVNRLVVLRGDYPEGEEKTEGDFHYANQLVAYIREKFNHDFHIKVGAYPEIHPQAKDAATDFENFKRKVESGADEAVTQYFFDIDAYARFLERCEKTNIKIPIVPGIMPISHAEKLLRFSDMCGAKIPPQLKKQLLSFQDDREGLVEFGIDLVGKLCEDLIALGAPGLHFYTLNQTEPTTTIVSSLKR